MPIKHTVTSKMLCNNAPHLFRKMNIPLPTNEIIKATPNNTTGKSNCSHIKQFRRTPSFSGNQIGGNPNIAIGENKIPMITKAVLTLNLIVLTPA